MFEYTSDRYWPLLSSNLSVKKEKANRMIKTSKAWQVHLS